MLRNAPMLTVSKAECRLGSPLPEHVKLVGVREDVFVAVTRLRGSDNTGAGGDGL